MNYAAIYFCDIGNGIGMRTSLYVSGCTHHCRGCFNEVAWDFNYGKPFTDEVQEAIIRESDHSYIDGITILGGEPMEIANQKALRPFIERYKARLPKQNIWLFSGYTWAELTDSDNKRCHGEDTDAILSMVDILVDGEFQIDSIDRRWRCEGDRKVRQKEKKRQNGGRPYAGPLCYTQNA